jgi:hypothetical protein
LNGAKDTNNRTKKNKGSITVETAIVLPVFILVVFFIAYFIRIFYIYNTMQSSLIEATRKIGNMSYFYHLSGLKDYSEEINEASKEAQDKLSTQFDTFKNALTSFNETVSRISSQGLDVNTLDNIEQGVDKFKDNLSEVSEVIEKIASDPKAEIQLFCTIFAQKLNYEINNKLICQIAKGLLSTELDIRTGSGKGEGATKLGIKNGTKGIDFKDSSVFGDDETLEFVVYYSIKVPLISEIRLSNRVKYTAWTGGRGESGKNKDDKKETESLWTRCDNNKQYWERGKTIEKSEVEKIIKQAQKGCTAAATPSKYPAIDAYVYNKTDRSIEYYDVFSLNPFLKTFSQRPGSISKEIKKHGASLLNFEAVNNLQNAEIKKEKRVLVVVIPENTGESAINECNSAKSELEKMNIEVRLIKGYGEYESPKNEKTD